MSLQHDGRLRFTWKVRANGVVTHIPRGSELVGGSNRCLCRKDEIGKAIESFVHDTNRISIKFSKTVNISACEHNWRLLNRHRVLLRAAGPNVFSYLVLRIMHLLNGRGKKRHLDNCRRAGSWPGDDDKHHRVVWTRQRR